MSTSAAPPTPNPSPPRTWNGKPIGSALLDVAKFPLLLAGLLANLLYYVLTEVETFLLAASSALLGYDLGWQWGVTAFVAGYFLLRVMGGYVSLLASKMHMIALVMREENDS